MEWRLICVILSLLFTSFVYADHNAHVTPKRYHNSSVDSMIAYNVKDVQLGCKELRSKRYISDGYCTSAKPIIEVVCAGFCLPIADLLHYTEVIQKRRTSLVQWKCVNDITKRERVHLVCKNGEKRSYRIRVVRACKCKRFIRTPSKNL